jgi:hypothetical protein
MPSLIIRDIPQPADQPYETAPPEYEYPFLKYGDSTAFVLTRFYKQTIAGWNADRLAGRYIPGQATDAKHTDAYMMAETKPVRTPSGMVAFERTFARLPEEQVFFGSQVITKPSPATNGGVNTVTREATGVGTSTLLGTTFEYLGYYWDMINGRVYGPSVAATGTDNAGNERITWNSHGLSGTERIAIHITAGSVLGLYLFDPGEYSVIDGNTVDLLGFATAIANVDAAAKYYRDYTPGTDRMGKRTTQRFYLPTITPGIATPTDIPLPDTLLNDSNFLAAIAVSASGYQTYDATELIRWNDWPIYTQSFTEIDMSTA